jgi:peptidoglycan L-alanyl-D-glutamate endopeptidase CwlK
VSIPGKAWKSPERLCDCVRVKFYEFKRRAKDAGIQITVIETERDEARQEHYVAKGASLTMNSMHLPQPPKGKALAFDVCPTEYLKLSNWNPSGASWTTLGKIGKNLGLKWGGDWIKPVDKPHFYQLRCSCVS